MLSGVGRVAEEVVLRLLQVVVDRSLVHVQAVRTHEIHVLLALDETKHLTTTPRKGKVPKTHAALSKYRSRPVAN